MQSFTAKAPLRRASLLLALLAGPASAATFTVNTDGSANASPDALTGNYCDTNSAAGNDNVCTLQAAIQLANDVSGFDTIVFMNGFTKVTLAASLQGINERVVIDGSTGNMASPRVEIDGNDTNGCFTASGNGYGAGGGPPLLPQANNSRFEHLVVHNCNGSGITLGGHGYVVSDSYIGVLPDGETASGNSSHGISVSASLADGGIPVIPNTPFPEVDNLAGIVTFLLSVVPNLAPNGIVGNVISGNDIHGIEIHGEYSAATIVFDNKIGTNADGDSPVPNGGGSGAGHGIQLSAKTYANVIGLDNVIAGHNDGATANDGIGDPQSYGIDIGTGAVPFPNVVVGNFIGTSPQSLFLEEDLGNAIAGINVTDARPSTTMDTPPVDNPLDISAIIGPGNIVGYNGAAVALDFPNDWSDINQLHGGILVGGGNSIGVKIVGNLVGISESVVNFVDIGNFGDGINISGTLHEVGGETLVLGNAVGANDRHGIVVRSTRSRVHGNSVGTLPLGEADVGNEGNGVWLTAGGNAVGVEPIGGEGMSEGNRIAFNGRHAVQLTTGNAWSNVIRKNEIFGVPPGFLGIDLDRPIGTADPNEVPSDDRNGAGARLYTNWQQNSIGFNSGGFAAGTTTLNFTLNSAPSGSYRVEFFTNPADGRGGKTFLGEQNVSTAGGTFTGSAALPGSPDTRGQYITATVTDLTTTADANGDPFPPGLTVHGPANNTSEFSPAFQIPDEIAFSSATYSVVEDSGSATITVSRTGSGIGAVQATISLTDASTEPADYGSFAPGAVVNWADGQTGPRQVMLAITPDLVDEIDETATLDITINSGAAVEGNPNSSVLTITDDDAPPTLSIAATGAAEGNALVWTVTRNGATDQTVTANYAVAPVAGTEAADIDASLDPLAGSISIAPGDSTDTISILAVDDAIFEPGEDVTATLSVPVGASLGTAAANATIAASDTAPVFDIDSPSVNETDANAPIVFTVTKTGATEITATVQYTTTPGTALATSDYLAGADPLAGTLTFLAGDASETVGLIVVGDDAFEALPPENFTVNLSAPAQASLGTASGLATITDDDVAQPGELQFTSLTFSVNETDAPANAVVTVERVNGTDFAASVDCSLSPGTASAGDDYAPASVGVSWNAGEAGQKTCLIPIVGDTLDEPNETVMLTLSNAQGALVGNVGNATLTIVDNDTPPVLTLSGPVPTTEGDTPNTTAFAFTATLSAPSGLPVSGMFSTADGTAMDADNDYEPLTQPFTIAAGDTQAMVMVTVNGDDTDEADETFTLTASDLLNATGQDSPEVAPATILNDDAAPPPAGQLRFTSATYSVGEAGPTATATVERINGAAGDVAVDCIVSAGTAGAADATLGTQTLAWGAGNFAPQNCTIAIADDLLDEDDETLMLALSNATGGATLDTPSAATLTITDDDVPPVASIADLSLAEGNGPGNTAFVFNVTLSAPSGRTVTVQAGTGGGSATVPGDYATANGVVTFVPGDVAQTFTVNVVGDTTDEGADETFDVTLSAPSNATLDADPVATGTIVNDDVPAPPAGMLQFSNATYSVGEAGVQATITVSRVGGSAGEVSVQYASANGSATAGSDYTPASGTLTWAAADTTDKSFTVPVANDATDEPDETVLLALNTPSGGASLGAPAAATLTITDDDPPAATGTLQFSAATYSVGEAGMQATITVTRTGGSAGAVSVQYASANGTATAGSDYTTTAGTLDWPDTDVASKSFTVPVANDATDEPDETVLLSLATPTGGATLGAPAAATLTITDDDPAAVAGTLQFSAATYSVGEAGVQATITVTRTGGSAGAIAVNYASSNGTATAGTDYTAAAGTLNWADADTAAKTFSVPVTNDAVDEPDETVTLALSGPANGAVLGAPATSVLTIVDDDVAAIGNKTFTGPTQPGTGMETVTFTGGGDPCGFTGTNALQAPAQPVPLGYVFPHGVFASTIGNCTVGATLTFTATYPQALPAGTVFWKYGRTAGDPTNHWYIHPAVINGATATYTLVDGGAGDDDLVANGTIVDPSGPAFLVQINPAGAGAPLTIPATDHRTRLLMVLLIGLFAAFALRQRR